MYPYTDWRDLPDDVLEREYAALSFLSDASYRCFIAAYPRYTLRHPADGAAVVDATIWSPIPDMYEGELVAFTRSKFALLTAEERDAIERALEALAPIEGLDAVQALASWRAERG